MHTWRYNAPMRTLLPVCLGCLSLFGQSAQSTPRPKEVAEKEKGQVTTKEDKLQKLPSDTGPSKAQLDGADHDSKPKNEDANGKTDPKPDWWMIGLTGGLVVVCGGQIWVLGYQAKVLSHHSELIRQSVEQMRQAVGAYQQFAETSQGMLALTRESNEITSRATELTRQSLILTHRPRLTIRNVVMD